MVDERGVHPPRDFELYRSARGAVREASPVLTFGSDVVGAANRAECFSTAAGDRCTSLFGLFRECPAGLGSR